MRMPVVVKSSTASRPKAHAAAKQFDAVIHFDQTRAVAPLERTAQWGARRATGDVPGRSVGMDLPLILGLFGGVALVLVVPALRGMQR